VQAFILSAGKGTRLLPYTNILPKPLFPILGKPIIEIILHQLKNLGITFIGINTFHLKEKLINFLKFYQEKNPQIEIRIFEERELMGTGGAIMNAKNLFKKETLIINSDILTNFNFKKLFSLF
jgi:mannose-1-phosphate guanylyltransferase